MSRHREDHEVVRDAADALKDLEKRIAGADAAATDEEYHAALRQAREVFRARMQLLIDEVDRRAAESVRPPRAH